MAHLGTRTAHVGITIGVVLSVVYGTFQLQQVVVLGEHGSRGSSLPGSAGHNGINGTSGYNFNGKSGNSSNGTSTNDNNTAKSTRGMY